MGSSNYFRFGQSDPAGVLICCECVKATGVCIDTNTQNEIGNNLPQTKIIQFGGVSISDGNPCGTTTTRCDGLFGVPLVLDLNVTAGDTAYENNCYFGYVNTVTDADCFDDGSIRPGYTLWLDPEPTLGLTARWVLDLWETNEGTTQKDIVFQWMSAYLAAPVDMDAWTGALTGTYDNSGAFGAPSSLQCWYQDVTAEILN